MPAQLAISLHLTARAARRGRARVRRELARARPHGLRVSAQQHRLAAAVQIGKSGGHTQPRACSRRNRFTIRSSSEWKLMTASRPPGPQHPHAAGSAASSAPSSSLTAIRSAWKTRFAGWPSPKRAGVGIAGLIVSTRSPVRSNGRSRAAAHDRPRDRPRVALLAVAAEDQRELALVGLVHELARRELAEVSMRMSSGASAA